MNLKRCDPNTDIKKVEEILTEDFECYILRDRISDSIVSSASISGNDQLKTKRRTAWKLSIICQISCLGDLKITRGS